MLDVCIAAFYVRSWAGTIDHFLIRWTAGVTGFHSILFARFNPGGDINRDPAGTVVKITGIPNLWHLEEAIQSMWLLLHYLENSTPREKNLSFGSKKVSLLWKTIGQQPNGNSDDRFFFSFRVSGRNLRKYRCTLQRVMTSENSSFCLRTIHFILS